MANYTNKAQSAAETVEIMAIVEFRRSLRGIQQANQLSALVWIFCMRCGHSKLTSPRWLVAQVKEAPDRFEALAKRLWCERCAQKGVELIAVPPGIAQVPLHSEAQANATEAKPPRTSIVRLAIARDAKANFDRLSARA
jgi:hypothetical protein